MKKAEEISTLTGCEVLLIVANNITINTFSTEKFNILTSTDIGQEIIRSYFKN